MSHFTTIKIAITDKEGLITALKNMGFEKIVTNKAIIRGYRGNKQQVDILVQLSGDYDFSFIKDKDSYQIVADWWGIAIAHPEINQQNLINNLNQQYTLEVTTRELKNKGFSISHEKMPDGSLRIIAKRIG